MTTPDQEPGTARTKAGLGKSMDERQDVSVMSTGRSKAGTEQLGDSGDRGSPARVCGGLLCMRCGYDLSGLVSDGNCPECGTPIAESMRGNLLVDRSPEYVRTLKRGISLVLNGILLYFVVMIMTIVGTVGFAFLSSASGSGSPSFLSSGSFTLISTAIDFAISALILFGYWLFTAHDPGDPVRDGSPTARAVLRVTVVVQAPCDGASLLLMGLVSAVSGTSALGGATPATAGPANGFAIAMLGISSLLGLVSVAAFVTIFFSAMLYVKNLAHRLPDDLVRRQAKSRIIACPIWSTVGILLLFLGPLIALILYWNLLHRVRLNLRRIVREQEYRAAGLQ